MSDRKLKLVRCVVCGRFKKPVGRDYLGDGFCQHECEGYQLDPWPGTLWPGEEMPPPPEGGT